MMLLIIVVTVHSVLHMRMLEKDFKSELIDVNTERNSRSCHHWWPFPIEGRP